jgi:membrane protein implicated in regulation of membrane protease activity
MPKQLSTPQAALLVGGFLLLMGLLVLAAYVVHKALRRRREETDLPAKTPRLKDETAVMLASLQGVIGRMKASV